MAMTPAPVFGWNPVAKSDACKAAGEIRGDDVYILYILHAVLLQDV
jgi:hypothetical protein